MIGYFSSGIARIPHLDVLLGDACGRITRFRPQAVTQVAGWGIKPSASRARRFAARRRLPYLSLEDGFLRSLGLGVNGGALHSLIVDTTGIYYDASRPSDLERLIAEAPFDAPELARATRGIAALRRHRLSKYNHAPDDPLPVTGRRRVLVVDQTRGDASVAFGGADEHTFLQMLQQAITDNPDAEVLVKIHPDVVAGKKQGYLLAAARQAGCTLLTEDLSPWAVLDAVEQVYVVSSQLGFDALLADKRVSCFGIPFYAGWGLTRDYQHCPRRGVSRSLEQLFAAAYLRYCRYINPYTGQRCELEDTIELITEQRRLLNRLRGDWLAVGFSRWKRSFLSGFLGSAARLRFVGSSAVRLDEVNEQTRLLVWASALAPGLHDACRSAGLSLWRMEDGFVRSVGLGVDRVPPLSLVLDSRGIYYDATTASDLEVLLNETQFDQALLARAARLRQRLVELQLSKYNVGKPESYELPPGRRILLVPGQVESDASIARGSPEVKSNLVLLQQVREQHPDAFIIYKPHPDVVGGGRYGAVSRRASQGLFDLQLSDVSITDLLSRVDEVHTISSLTGFEALLRGVKVVTYGLPFYAGWGLTQDRIRCSRRCRRLTLDQLVAATLICYPVYVDPQTAEQIDVESAITLLAAQRTAGAGTGMGRRLYRLFRNLFLKR